MQCLVADNIRVDQPPNSANRTLVRWALQFWHDEEGSSTVEMVVMMSASITLGIAVMGTVSDGVENLSNDIAAFISDYEIVTSFEPDSEEEVHAN